LIPRVPPFKVTQGYRNHTDRSAICDFLLMSHSNYGHILYRIQDKRRFQSKQNFPTPVYCILRLAEGFPWNWVPALGVKKTRMSRVISLTISSAVWIQTPTWQTDGHTDTGQQQRPRLRIASRVKKFKSPLQWWQIGQ